MKLIFYNLRSMLKQEKVISFLIIICIIISSIILNFAYGLYRNYDREKAEASADLQEIQISINKETNLTKKEFKTYVESVSEETQKNISIWFISGYLEYFEGYSYPWLDCRFVYRNDEYTIPDVFRKNKEKFSYSGRFITDDEESSGAYVTVVSNKQGGGWNSATEKLRVSENEIEMFDKVFEVVGETKQGAVTPIIPFLTVPDDFVFDDVLILHFEQTLNKKVYNELKTKADQIIPGKLSFPELALPDTDSLDLFNNIIWISLFISTLSVMNFALLYRFILEKRSESLAIMRMCGCPRNRAFFLYIAECIMITIPLYAVGTGLYKLLLDNVLSSIFPFIMEYESIVIYLSIFLVYLFVTVIILSIMIQKWLCNTIMQEWRESRQ